MSWGDPCQFPRPSPIHCVFLHRSILIFGRRQAMSSYAKLGALTIQLDTPIQTVTAFDTAACEFKGYLILDSSHLRSGAMDALKAINNIQTTVGPFILKLQGESPDMTPFSYTASEERAPTPPVVIAFAQRIPDHRRGDVTPFFVRLPRHLWPTHVGEGRVYQLHATITVEFTNMLSGKLMERVTRDARTQCQVYLAQ
ncbi:uncharacterized protein EI90DRAFT_2066448 [Cantharellus anzutake]|uniref:uncharacterized protein n=1 Tax=Cantharellus anzutake TaxID=1750568 RepID=UPI0019088998|nr:uncharacterized protein EI90DRAFT_2066448 [Cantharellus anzutake]KAF8340461.1 hypothetical protein EI90DRAFT_2066448 [Cantharellus anzutake]